ncbi:hypothetical protein MTBLM1_210003 [Rhodospirillaceae bacterium LM-1]|nr:hypothetical protein MTBLM1_210003 [Rhodospirillaceae bacterium LM-1]
MRPTNQHIQFLLEDGHYEHQRDEMDEPDAKQDRHGPGHSQKPLSGRLLGLPNLDWSYCVFSAAIQDRHP